MVDLVLNNRTSGRGPSRAFFARICAATESFLKVPKGHRAEIGITLLSRTRMRTLNRKRRGIDRSTDVLSFPLHMRPVQGYTAVLLGDLFICPDVVREYAEMSGSTIRSRMAWTVVHGLLHLAGYDHEKGVASARRMAMAERRILKHLKP